MSCVDTSDDVVVNCDVMVFILSCDVGMVVFINGVVMVYDCVVVVGYLVLVTAYLILIVVSSLIKPLLVLF